MYVCGQKSLTQRIDYLSGKDRFPRFSIIVGAVGFGKKVISEYISQKIGALFVPCETKVDAIREIRENAYNTTQRTLYMFADCDGISSGAANALLKVTEEPPNESYFVMTVTNLNNVLPTLISRGTVFTMGNYTVSDINEFITHKGIEFTDNISKIVQDISVCPNDVLLCQSTDIEKLYKLADTFVNNIGVANLGNELKIPTLLAIKDDDTDKLNPVLFLRYIMQKCNSLCVSDLDNIELYSKLIKITSSYLHTLTTKGCNKQLELDNWIIECHVSVGGKI